MVEKVSSDMRPMGVSQALRKQVTHSMLQASVGSM